MNKKEEVRKWIEEQEWYKSYARTIQKIKEQRMENE